VWAQDGDTGADNLPCCTFFVVSLTVILISECPPPSQLFSSSPAQHKSQRGGLIIHKAYLLTQLPPYLPTYYFISICLFLPLCRCPTFFSPRLLSPLQFSFLLYYFLSFSCSVLHPSTVSNEYLQNAPIVFAMSVRLYLCSCNDYEINS
jgi:hypothetical protein